MVEDNLKPIESVKTILKKDKRKGDMFINIVFYGSIAVAMISGIIKFLISR